MTTHAPAADDPIVVEGLAKTYQVTDREGGFGAAVKSFVKRKYKDVKAVQNVNFRIGQGEIVGFLGPKSVVSAEIKTDALVAARRCGCPRHSSSLLVTRNTL